MLVCNHREHDSGPYSIRAPARTKPRLKHAEKGPHSGPRAVPRGRPRRGTARRRSAAREPRGKDIILTAVRSDHEALVVHLRGVLQAEKRSCVILFNRLIAFHKGPISRSAFSKRVFFRAFGTFFFAIRNPRKHLHSPDTVTRPLFYTPFLQSGGINAEGGVGGVSLTDEHEPLPFQTQANPVSSLGVGPWRHGASFASVRLNPNEFQTQVQRGNGH